MFEKQVDAALYDFKKYIDKGRWNSFYHQIDEILAIQPCSVLEIGVGSGVLGAVFRTFHYPYESMDIDPELHPDHVGSVLHIPFMDKSYDVVGCFQVLEHLSFDYFSAALCELFRTAKKGVIISLPNDESVFSIQIPKLCWKKMIRRPFRSPRTHQFDGQHYWEINKKGFELPKIKKRIEKAAGEFGFILEKDFRVWENPYHHFFIMTPARGAAS
jgi:SAM-dependent methyltransferase